MAIYKCKMCGGSLEISQDMRVCECQYCGSRQTLPKLSDEKKSSLIDRANHFRRNNEYDKAMAFYEQILNEDTEDAESYWSLVLCRYGIEYVEDPATHRRVPTVNRAQFASVFADEDYKAALKYADGEQRGIYEAEAREIERIQKGILAISSKEEPFDVFICYKESDANGRRTPDSVLANDLYYQLTQEGFKVFFARITLEDKLGSAYEPYIFAALNSAKVMVVLGTRQEYFNAVWVKNEWSRFLALMKGGAKKTLIPAYRDMDPYDLPEEFAYLQALDMGKLGFMQDLIRGIKKLTGETEKKETAAASASRDAAAPIASSGTADALVKRAYLALEDGDFKQADAFCEQALNLDPENARVYVAKLMSEMQVRKQEELGEGKEALEGKNYFQKALRFAGDGLKAELNRYNEMIIGRGKDSIYGEAEALMEKSGQMTELKEALCLLDGAIAKFESMLGWRDSGEKIEECKNRKKDCVYKEAERLMEKSGQTEEMESAIQFLEEAIGKYTELLGWKDSKGQMERCKEMIVQCQIRQEENRKNEIYEKAEELFGLLGEKNRKSRTFYQKINILTEAMEKYESIQEWKDGKEKIHQCETVKAELIKQFEKEGKKKKKSALAALVLVLLVMASGVSFNLNNKKWESVYPYYVKLRNIGVTDIHDIRRIFYATTYFVPLYLAGWVIYCGKEKREFGKFILKRNIIFCIVYTGLAIFLIRFYSTPALIERLFRLRSDGYYAYRGQIFEDFNLHSMSYLVIWTIYWNATIVPETRKTVSSIRRNMIKWLKRIGVLLCGLGTAALTFCAYEFYGTKSTVLFILVFCLGYIWICKEVRKGNSIAFYIATGVVVVLSLFGFYVRIDELMWYL